MGNSATVAAAGTQQRSICLPDEYLGSRREQLRQQCLAAVQKLERLGYTFAGEWMHPANDASMAVLVWAVADPMHRLPVQRADVLEGRPKGSAEEAELEGR